MDRWMNRWIDRWMDRWMDRSKGGQIDRLLCRNMRADYARDRWIDRKIERQIRQIQTDKKMDGGQLMLV